MQRATRHRRLGVIAATALAAIGLAVFPPHIGADNGGNGGGNGNGNTAADAGNGNGNGNGRGDDNADDDDNGDAGAGHVEICHIPPGNPDNEHTIEVGSPAVEAHEDEHGDTVGPCPEDTTTTTSTTTTSTTTSTSSSTTEPAVAPGAVSDTGLVATVGIPFAVNVLANDVVGTPPAVIVLSFDATGACGGLALDPATGVFAGIPAAAGNCVFVYAIQNTAGFDVAAVLVTISV